PRSRAQSKCAPYHPHSHRHPHSHGMHLGSRPRSHSVSASFHSRTRRERERRRGKGLSHSSLNHVLSEPQQQRIKQRREASIELERQSGNGTTPRAIVMSLVSTMLGSSILSLSYGYSEAGIIGGPLVVIFAAIVCAETGILIVRAGNAYSRETGLVGVDFPTVAAHFLGEWAVGAGSIASLVVLSGAMMAFFMYIVAYITSIGYCFGVEISYVVSVPLSFGALGSLSLLREVKLLVKVAGIGLYFTIFLSLCVVVVAVDNMPTQTCSTEGYLFQGGASRLFGITISQFMVHNLLLSVLKGTKSSERRPIVRSTLSALCMVNLCVGMTGYMGFRCDGVPQNFSTLFPQTPLGSIVFVVQLAYILAIFPLLQMVVRDNVSGLLMALQNINAVATLVDRWQGDVGEEGEEVELPLDRMGVSSGPILLGSDSPLPRAKALPPVSDTQDPNRYPPSTAVGLEQGSMDAESGSLGHLPDAWVREGSEVEGEGEREEEIAVEAALTIRGMRVSLGGEEDEVRRVSLGSGYPTSPSVLKSLETGGEAEGEGEGEGELGMGETSPPESEGDIPPEEDAPGRTRKADITISLTMLCLASVTAILFPNVGDILGLCGAAGGLIYVFVLPLLCYRHLELSRDTWTVGKLALLVILLIVGTLGLVMQLV
ncbi:hypothetical protein KIPB_006227, partial [Kipferlia bialata]